MPTDRPKPQASEGLVIVPLGGPRPSNPSGGRVDGPRVGTEQLTPKDDGPKSSGNGRIRVTR